MVSFEEYETAALAQGFDEVLVRQWGPSSVQAPHVHPFAVKALVVDGEMWLTVGEETRHLQAGDSFEMESQVLHSERYGEAGATYWAARRQ
jgi:mannose-6-phosphate isomerase-like protein (cupin superfamily)